MVESFARDPDFKKICIQVAEDNHEDLFQELALIFMELPDKKITHIDQTCLKCFYYKVARQQYCSKNSNFHRKYRRINQIIKKHPQDIIQVNNSDAFDEELFNDVNRVLKELYWYDSGILKLYAEKGTLREVSQCTGIAMKSVHNTITNTKKLIKKKIYKNA